MDDVWVCSGCKSINRRRDERCYRCHEPREARMAMDGPDPRLMSAVINRQVSEYLPSWPLAVLAGGLILAVSVLGIVILVDEASRYGALRDAFLAALSSDPAHAEEALAGASIGSLPLALLHLGLSVLALGAFAGWLALATHNVPALGGGIPSRGPIRVFIYTLIPLWQLIKVPGMIQDVLYRLDPEAGGFFMVVAAWLGLVGSRFVSWFGGWLITVAAFGDLVEADSIDGATAVFASLLDQTFVLGIVVEAMVAVGAILLVALVARIERRCALRDREIRAAAAGA